MERALVVAEDSEVGRQLLKEAATLAAGIDAELIVLQVIDEKRYDGSLEKKVQSGNNDQIDSTDDVTERLRSTADAVAPDIVDGVDYQPIDKVGKLPDTIIETAVEDDGVLTVQLESGSSSSGMSIRTRPPSVRVITLCEPVF